MQEDEQEEDEEKDGEEERVALPSHSQVHKHQPERERTQRHPSCALRALRASALFNQKITAAMDVCECRSSAHGFRI